MRLSPSAHPHLFLILKDFQCPEEKKQNIFLVIPLLLLLLSLATILSSESSVAQRTLALLASASLLASAYTLRFIPLRTKPGPLSPADDVGSTLRSLLTNGGAQEQRVRTARNTARPTERRKEVLDWAGNYLPLLNLLICTVLAAVAAVAWYTTITSGPGSTDTVPPARVAAAAAAAAAAAKTGYNDSTTTRRTATEPWTIYTLTIPPVLVYLILAIAVRYIMASSANAVAQLEELQYEYKGA